jgi:hypothetical protein
MYFLIAIDYHLRKKNKKITKKNHYYQRVRQVQIIKKKLRIKYY